MRRNPSGAMVLQVSKGNQSENKQLIFGQHQRKMEDTVLIRQNENALTGKNNNCFTLWRFLSRQHRTSEHNLFLWNPAVTRFFFSACLCGCCAQVFISVTKCKNRLICKICPLFPCLEKINFVKGTQKEALTALWRQQEISFGCVPRRKTFIVVVLILLHTAVPLCAFQGVNSCCCRSSSGGTSLPALQG